MGLVSEDTRQREEQTLRCIWQGFKAMMTVKVGRSFVFSIDKQGESTDLDAHRALQRIGEQGGA